MIRLRESTRERFERVTSQLLAWYAINQRSFIWRDLRRTPYVVMVSEFMLQQTQAAMIETKLPQFLRQFPTVRSLALAPTADVIRAWQGLGYNRRALNLQKSAQALHARGRKPFPNTLEELMALPGVGHYTASAILSFSFNQDVPVVDVNIERVLSRVWKRMSTTGETLPVHEIIELDGHILPRGKSGLWHQALMDHGATICTKRKPKCDACPIRLECKSRSALEHGKGETAPTASRETLYAGEPRRVWRGRVLKLIAAKHGATVAAIERQLGIDRTLLHSILRDLTSEGFIAKRGTRYQLA